ncbi:hypothetical protein LINPERPRIM_LOCUS30620, partial [Linum perenne]
RGLKTSYELTNAMELEAYLRKLQPNETSSKRDELRLESNGKAWDRRFLISEAGHNHHNSSILNRNEIEDAG